MDLKEVPWQNLSLTVTFAPIDDILFFNLVNVAQHGFDFRYL